MELHHGELENTYDRENGDSEISFAKEQLGAKPSGSKYSDCYGISNWIH